MQNWPKKAGQGGCSFRLSGKASSLRPLCLKSLVVPAPKVPSITPSGFEKDNGVDFNVSPHYFKLMFLMSFTKYIIHQNSRQMANKINIYIIHMYMKVYLANSLLDTYNQKHWRP